MSNDAAGSEPFCEFGGLPVSACGHCREKSFSLSRGLYQCPSCFGPSEGPGSCRECLGNVGVGEALEILRSIGQAAVRDRWRGFWRIAFGAQEDWEAMAAVAERHFGLGPWFLSQYGSRCKGCGSTIYDGDTVRFSDDEGGVVCLDCGAEGE